jgi:hypothetical protein
MPRILDAPLERRLCRAGRALDRAACGPTPVARPAENLDGAAGMRDLGAARRVRGRPSAL